MKILCFIDNLGSGGAQRQIVVLAQLLSQEGHDVSLLLYSEGDFFKSCAEELDISINYIHAKSYIYRILAVRKHIRNGNYDTVISFLDTPNFLNNLAAIGGRKWKVVISERNSKEQFLLSTKGRIFAMFVCLTDVIVCNSYNAKTMWEKHYPKYKQKLSVIYNPVLLPVLTEEYTPNRNGMLNVLIAASYQYRKNPLGLIEAIALMSDSEKSQLCINWYGSVVEKKGNKSAYNESLSKIKEYKLESIINLNGETVDIANKMQHADVVALFSDVEGLPNAIIEGMMIGKAIIMTKVSDYQVLVDTSNGILCDWDKPETIKNALIYMMERTKDELLAMGKQSRQKANHLFSKENITGKWMNVINQS